MRRLLLYGWIVAVMVTLLIAGCGPPTDAPTAVPSGSRMGGKVELVNIPAPSLSNNVYGEPAQRQVAVYLPPSYEGSTRRFPVVYYLPGMGVTLDSPRGYPLIQAGADRMLELRNIREMIVVTVSGFNTLGASLYVNSPVNGNWEDFVAQDVVGYLDAHYRTLATPASRGISGHSMGGFGALNLAMHHPDVFGAVYSLSPALFDSQGLAGSSMFASQEVINAVLDRIESIANLPPDRAAGEFLRLYAGSDSAVQMTFAYGAAFSPAADGKPPYIKYPYSRTAGELTRDPVTWSQWESGWGALDGKVEQYGADLRKLKGVEIEYGELDENAWIPRGCQYLSRRLTAAGVPNGLLTFKGTHYSRLGERIEAFLLPFFSERLDFEAGRF